MAGTNPVVQQQQQLIDTTTYLMVVSQLYLAFARPRFPSGHNAVLADGFIVQGDKVDQLGSAKHRVWLKKVPILVTSYVVC